MLCEQVLDVLFFFISDELVYYVSIFSELNFWDGGDALCSCELCAMVDIDAKVDKLVLCVGEAFEHGGDGLAGRAPISTELYHHQSTRGNLLGFFVVLCVHYFGHLLITNICKIYI